MSSHRRVTYYPVTARPGSLPETTAYPWPAWTTDTPGLLVAPAIEVDDDGPFPTGEWVLAHERSGLSLPALSGPGYGTTGRLFALASALAAAGDWTSFARLDETPAGFRDTAAEIVSTARRVWADVDRYYGTIKL